MIRLSRVLIEGYGLLRISNTLLRIYRIPLNDYYGQLAPVVKWRERGNILGGSGMNLIVFSNFLKFIFLYFIGWKIDVFDILNFSKNIVK